MKMYHALATIEKGAVGNHAMGITDALVDQGVSVEMFAETIREEYRDKIQFIDELEKKLHPENVVMYQFANPSIMADLLYEKPCKLIVNYHNVTPAHFFSKWSPATSQIIARARLQLARLAEVAHSAIAVSSYNAQELIELGYKNVEVIPPVFSNSFYDDENIRRDYSKANWLYVGRIAPHKNIHVLLRAFEYYLDNIDSDAKLTIVGRSDVPIYGNAINELISKRNFGSSLSFVEHASLKDLVSIYQQATVFVMPSEHEGFCIPLVESMANGLPLVAVASAAVPDTVGSAGVLLSRPDYIEIAHSVDALHKDVTIRESNIQNGFIRAKRFDPKETSNAYVDYIKAQL